LRTTVVVGLVQFSGIPANPFNAKTVRAPRYVPTKRIDTHLLPASEERTRRAIDRAFGYSPDDNDGLATA
jgi:hypothetical protein